MKKSELRKLVREVICEGDSKYDKATSKYIDDLESFERHTIREAIGHAKRIGSKSAVQALDDLTMQSVKCRVELTKLLGGE